MSKLELTPEQLTNPKLKVIIANKLKGLKAKAEGTHKGSRNGRYGKEVKKSTKEKLKIANTGKTHTDEAKRKSARPGEQNGMFGNGHLVSGDKNGFYKKTHSQKTKETLSKKAVERNTDHYCVHCNKYFTSQAYKQYHGDRCSKNPKPIIVKRKQKKLSGPQIKLTCPHCGLQGGEGNMKRYHMDNCKAKP